MKEQIFNGLNNEAMKQWNNGVNLTLHPLPPTLSVERDIFMAEPGGGETVVPERQEVTNRPELEIYARTLASEDHPDRNEDAIFQNQEKRIFGVLDGMGGHAAGEVASRLAKEQLAQDLEEFPDNASLQQAQDRIRQSLLDANRKVNNHGIEHGLHGMGTTAVAGYIWEGEGGEKKAIIGNVGDSRAYLYRNGELSQITLDDNLLREQFQGDEEKAKEAQAKFNNVVDPNKELTENEQGLFNNRNILTQAVGSRENIEPSVYTVDLQEGDRLFLGSDGISDNLTDNEIADILKSSVNNDQAVERLIEASRQRSGDKSHARAKPDDMSALVVDIGRAESARQGQGEQSQRGSSSDQPREETEPSTQTGGAGGEGGGNREPPTATGAQPEEPEEEGSGKREEPMSEAGPSIFVGIPEIPSDETLRMSGVPEEDILRIGALRSHREAIEGAMRAGALNTREGYSSLNEAVRRGEVDRVAADPYLSALGARARREMQREEGEGLSSSQREMLNDSRDLVNIISNGTPDTYNQTFSQIEEILDRQNSNDTNYGRFLIRSTIETLRGDREDEVQKEKYYDRRNEIDYFLEYAMERILLRADVNAKAQYPQFTLEEQINLGDILAHSRIHDHSINLLTGKRPEGAQGTVFKYLNDLQQRRLIMHELFRNMKDRQTYVSFITQNLRKEGLAFVEKEIAGVADSQIVYEKFLGSALSFKKGWLTAADLEDVDKDVGDFMAKNSDTFRKNIKDENGEVVGSRTLRPWELKRAAIVGRSLNAAMQRRIVYTVLGDVPDKDEDIDTLIDSVDSEYLARILAPMKLITQRFLGIDTNTRKIFIEELLKKTKELAKADNNQRFGYGEEDKDGNRKGLYGKKEDSLTILDTGVVDPKSSGWRGRKMWLKQEDYRTENLRGEALSIGDYFDQVKFAGRTEMKEELERRYPGKNRRQIDDMLDGPKYRDELNNKFNDRVKAVVQKQRLFLGVLVQMGNLGSYEVLDEKGKPKTVSNKEVIWNNVAELIPSRIAAFFPDETLGIIEANKAVLKEDQEQRQAETGGMVPPPVESGDLPPAPTPDAPSPAPLPSGESPSTETQKPQTAQEIWENIRNKLFLAESKRVADDARIIKGKTWDAVDRLEGKDKLKNLSDYFKEVGIDESEKLIIEQITNLGKGKAEELAKIKFPYTPFLDDVPKTDWENIDDVSYDRILVNDHSRFEKGYGEIIGLMAKPIVQPEQVVEVFNKAVIEIQDPLGLEYQYSGAQKVIEKYISSYLSMIRENGLSKWLGPIMKTGRIPRSKMEQGNLQSRIAANEDFISKVLDGLAQQDVTNDDPAKKDKNGLTQHMRMKKENKADGKAKLYYWIRIIAMLLGPIAAAEIAKTLLPREAAEQVLTGF